MLIASYTGFNLLEKFFSLMFDSFFKSKFPRKGPKFFLNSTSCPSPYGNIKMSEKIIAASNSNLLSGCKVILGVIFLFKHNLIKFGFFFLISLNSGKYLPACLIIQIGLILFFFLIIQD